MKSYGVGAVLGFAFDFKNEALSLYLDGTYVETIDMGPAMSLGKPLYICALLGGENTGAVLRRPTFPYQYKLPAGRRDPLPSATSFPSQ